MWAVERVVHFDPGDFLRDGLAHFGFHLRDGRYCALDHPGHRAALVDANGAVEAVEADLDYPMFADVLADGAVIVSNFGSAALLRIDPVTRAVTVLVDGTGLGLVDMGNCVVDVRGDIWVNEVRGCRIRHFAADGRLLETLGDGEPGFQTETAPFEEARFNWIYDIRRGAGDTIVVLDSRNFAVRILDLDARTVRLLAGGDGTFGSNPNAPFDGPISLAVHDDGTVFVGDRFNERVCMIEEPAGAVSTLEIPVPLPAISSMDYWAGRLYVPTDLADGAGELVVLRRQA